MTDQSRVTPRRRVDQMTRRGRALLAALLLTAAAALTACGNHKDWDVAGPAAWGPTWGGQTYCGYIVTPLECTGHPGIPMQMPATAPMGYHLGMTTATDLATALFLQRLTYHAYYGSPAYYNQYVPTTYRASYTNVYVAPFDRSYSSAERSVESRAVYRNRKGSTIPAGKVNVSKLRTQQPARRSPATTKAPAGPGGKVKLPPRQAPNRQAPAPAPRRR